MSAIERHDDPTDQLVHDHFGLVGRISRKFKVSANVREDLEAEGYCALVKAARKDTLGVQEAFNAYASRYIEGAMLNYLRQKRQQQLRTSPRDLNDIPFVPDISEPDYLDQENKIENIQDFLAAITFMAGLTKEEVLLLRDDTPLSETEDEQFSAKARAVEKVRRAIDQHGSYLSDNEIEYSASFMRHHRINTDIILEEDIIECANLHKQYTNGHKYPSAKSKTLNDIQYGILAGMKWSQIDHALKVGLYGLPKLGGLKKFLKSRHLTNQYTATDILQSAALHKRRTGKYPSQISGEILDGPLKGRTWSSVDRALANGLNGLPGGSSLAEFLAENGMTNDISIEDILESARLHKENSENGKYPSELSGEVKWGPLKGDNWRTISMRLRLGQLGLPAGSSLSKLLLEHGMTNDITEDQIWECAELHKQNSEDGKYPTADSGKVLWGPLKGKTWGAINNALSRGSLGLPGGSSLSKLIKSRSAEIQHQANNTEHLQPSL